MSWDMAMFWAKWAYAERRRKMYVRGYRTHAGVWRYGTYDMPRPANGRDWSVY